MLFSSIIKQTLILSLVWYQCRVIVFMKNSFLNHAGGRLCRCFLLEVLCALNIRRMEYATLFLSFHLGKNIPTKTVERLLESQVLGPMPLLFYDTGKARNKYHQSGNWGRAERHAT